MHVMDPIDIIFIDWISTEGIGHCNWWSPLVLINWKAILGRSKLGLEVTQFVQSQFSCLIKSVESMFKNYLTFSIHCWTLISVHRFQQQTRSSTDNKNSMILWTQKFLNYEKIKQVKARTRLSMSVLKLENRGCDMLKSETLKWERKSMPRLTCKVER